MMNAGGSNRDKDGKDGMPGRRDKHDKDETRDRSDPNDAFERGLTLFNRGDFFACHEVWEELWLRSAGAEKLFYQGLIQIAVAILHAERGNWRGASSTWRKAHAKLAMLPAQHQGIALGELLEAVATFLADASVSAQLPARPKIVACE
jgi:predicted metal-dependent hydrolase